MGASLPELIGPEVLEMLLEFLGGLLVELVGLVEILRCQ